MIELQKVHPNPFNKFIFPLPEASTTSFEPLGTPSPEHSVSTADRAERIISPPLERIWETIIPAPMNEELIDPSSSARAGTPPFLKEPYKPSHIILPLELEDLEDRVPNPAPTPGISDEPPWTQEDFDRMQKLLHEGFQRKEDADKSGQDWTVSCMSTTTLP